MESYSDILFFSIIILIVWAGIIYVIIQNATKAKTIVRNSEIQVRLLMKIAEKNGVGKQDIDWCIDPHSKKQ